MLGVQFYKTKAILGKEGVIAIMTTKQEAKDKFESWLENQPDEVKELLKERFESLENTVKATRGERDNLNKELKELAKKVTEDSEAGKQLSDLRARLDASEKKSNFIEQALKQGATKPSAIYAVANAESLFTEDGNPDWNKIKETIPEFFKVTNTSNNAGSGTNKNALPKHNVNDAIREAANKQIR